MFGNNNWYLFIRLHDVLCERLQNIASQAQKLADDMEEEEVGDGNEMAQLGFLFHQLCSVVETSLQ